MLDSTEKDTLEEYEIDLITQTLVELLVGTLCEQDAAFAGRLFELGNIFRPAICDIVQRATLRNFSQDAVIVQR